MRSYFLLRSGSRRNGSAIPISSFKATKGYIDALLVRQAIAVPELEPRAIPSIDRLSQIASFKVEIVKRRSEIASPAEHRNKASPYRLVAVWVAI